MPRRFLFLGVSMVPYFYTVPVSNFLALYWCIMLNILKCITPAWLARGMNAALASLYSPGMHL